MTEADVSLRYRQSVMVDAFHEQYPDEWIDWRTFCERRAEATVIRLQPSCLCEYGRSRWNTKLVSAAKRATLVRLAVYCDACGAAWHAAAVTG